MLFNERFQRSGTVQAGGQKCGEASPAQQSLCMAFGIGCGEFVVPVRTEEGVGCGERARTHACNDVELGPVAALAPADQHASAIGPVCSTSREGEDGASLIAASEPSAEILGDAVQAGLIVRRNPRVLRCDQAALQLVKRNFRSTVDGRACTEDQKAGCDQGDPDLLHTSFSSRGNAPYRYPRKLAQRT